MTPRDETAPNPSEDDEAVEIISKALLKEYCGVTMGRAIGGRALAALHTAGFVVARENDLIVQAERQLAESDELLARASDDLDGAASEISELRAALSAALAERDAARAKLDAINARKFPIMSGPAIPWSLIEPFEKEAQSNHGQTLKRLAERGGLSMGEAVAIMTGKRWSEIKEPSVDEFLRFIASRTALTPARQRGREGRGQVVSYPVPPTNVQNEALRCIAADGDLTRHSEHSDYKIQLIWEWLRRHALVRRKGAKYVLTDAGRLALDQEREGGS